MIKTFILLAVSLIALTEINAQGNEHNDLEHLYRNNPTYKVNTLTYFREYDNSDSAIKATIPKGSKIKVIDSFFKVRWQVLYQGERGWVNESDLSFHESGIKNEIEISALDSSYRNQPFYFVTTETSLKEHMSNQSATLTIVPEGVKVRVINSFFEDWWEVIYDNRRGNLQKNLLSKKEISQSHSQPQTQSKIKSQSQTFAESKPKPRTSINTVKYLKRVYKPTSLRENPDSKSKIILRFKAGNKVSVIDDSGKWWSKVQYKEKVGWVKKSILRD